MRAFRSHSLPALPLALSFSPPPRSRLPVQPQPNWALRGGPPRLLPRGNPCSSLRNCSSESPPPPPAHSLWCSGVGLTGPGIPEPGRTGLGGADTLLALCTPLTPSSYCPGRGGWQDRPLQSPENPPRAENPSALDLRRWPVLRVSCPRNAATAAVLTGSDAATGCLGQHPRGQSSGFQLPLWTTPANSPWPEARLGP